MVYNAEEYAYKGFMTSLRFVILMIGIKTLIVDTVNMNILASSYYSTKLDTCVTLYKYLLKQTDNQPEFNITDFNTQ